MLICQVIFSPVTMKKLIRGHNTITNRIHNEINYLFTGIECFEGTFSLQVKRDSCPFQALPRRVAPVLQKPLNEELELLQKHQITVPLGVDEMSECCNSFILVPKAN